MRSVSESGSASETDFVPKTVSSFDFECFCQLLLSLNYPISITPLTNVSFTFGITCVLGLWSINLLALSSSSEN
jgi:hypothetical protein